MAPPPQVKVCLQSAPATCFTRNTPNAPATPFVFTVTDANCGAADTTCLRASTPYTATTTGVRADSVKSLESDPTSFTTSAAG